MTVSVSGISGNLFLSSRGFAYTIYPKGICFMTVKVFMSFLQIPSVRYIAPFICFMLFTEAQRFFAGPSIFAVYGVKITLTALLLWFFFHKKMGEIPGKWNLSSVLVGIAALLVWIPLCAFVAPEQKVVFQPDEITSPFIRGAALAVRTAGAVLIVPVMEELLWRSFLMRYLIDPQFLKVPIGKYTHLSFWGTAAAFVLVHRPWEWSAALITAILYGGYLVKTGNLRGCILAHAVTNLGLAVYVMISGRWYFW